MSVTSESNEEDNEGVQVECHNCGYEWLYTGEMWNATCPQCGNKTKTPFHQDYDSEDC